MALFPRQHSGKRGTSRREKVEVTLADRSDYLIERALSRRAKHRKRTWETLENSESNDSSSTFSSRSSQSNDGPLLEGQMPPTKREAWGPPKSDCATEVTVVSEILSPGGISAHMRSRSLADRTFRRTNLLKSSLRRTFDQTESDLLTSKVSTNLEGMDCKAERAHSKFDRLVGKIRGDVDDFRDRLRSLLNSEKWRVSELEEK